MLLSDIDPETMSGEVIVTAKEDAAARAEQLRKATLDDVQEYLDNTGIDMAEATAGFEEEVSRFVTETRLNAAREQRELTDEEIQNIKNAAQLVKELHKTAEAIR